MRKSAVHAFVEADGIKLADLAHALRMASTGKAVGAGLFDCLAILGREKVAGNIARALTLVQG